MHGNVGQSYTRNCIVLLVQRHFRRVTTYLTILKYLLFQPLLLYNLNTETKPFSYVSHNLTTPLKQDAMCYFSNVFLKLYGYFGRHVKSYDS